MIAKVVCFIFLFCLAVSDVSWSLDWEWDVKLTNSGENSIIAPALATLDWNGNLHVVYSYANFQDEDSEPFTPVHQVFNMHGEPLSDILVIGRFADIPDTERVRALACKFDNHHYLNVLWGLKTLHISKIGNMGRLDEPDILLQGIGSWHTNVAPAGSHFPDFIITPDDEIVVFGNFTDYNIHHEERAYPIALARFNPDGEMIDTLYVIDEEFGGVTNFNILYDSNDVIHCAWRLSGNQPQSFYCQFNNQYEMILEPMTLTNSEGDDILRLSKMVLDSHNNPLFLYLTANPATYHIMRFNEDQQIDMNIRIGEPYYEIEDIMIDRNDNLHVALDYDDPELGFNYLAYAAYNRNGEQIAGFDRLTQVDYGRPVIKITSDGILGVLWTDTRDGGIRSPEIYYRYTDHFTSVKEKSETNLRRKNSANNAIIYPNPTQGQVFIQPFSISNRLSVQLYDLNGRLIRKAELSSSNLGEPFTWDINPLLNAGLPASKYVVVMQTPNKSFSQLLTIIR